jgi:Fe-S-cluster-containing hydrogenase component 2
MAKQVMPPAQLETRPTDVKVTDDLLLKISLFAQLKRKPSLDKFPGSLVLRRFRKGDVICRQGEAGWTAFYILTTEDAFELCQALYQGSEPGEENLLWQTLWRNQAFRLAQIKADPNNPELRRAATAHLTVARPTPVDQSSSFQRSMRRWLGAPTDSAGPRPLSIRIDAPTDIDYETMKAPLSEGELFGEISCRHGTPRSATIIADHDCFMLEMLRNILDQVQKDAAYKARTDEAYKKRLLQFQRKLSIFADLTDAQFEALRERIDLVVCEPGQILYDEFERADSLYLIQRGMIKVVKKASALLGPEHVRDWKALAAALCTAEKEAMSPRQRLWQLMGESARTACRAAAAGGTLPESGQREVLHALNEAIKNRKLSTFLEFSKIAKSEEFQEKTQGFPAQQKEWSEQDWRRYNRLLVDEALGTLIRSHRRRVGPDCVLFYCSAGDFLGELSVLGGPYRAETCLAQGHAKDVGTAKDAGPVELVRVPADALRELLDESPALRARLERKVAERRKRTQEQVRVPVWDDSREVLLSEKFQQLGLIQGQRLMLIDLDRCTRCDECVRACVGTHADGRSRLFLDGPRFGRYLIPTSCRSCLDPVCMIGCPVGSIHRGDNGQMVIEDWCIGCGLCAQQCPYGSIHMHDIGVVAENAHGWRYLPESVVSSNRWVQRRFRDRRWLEGTGPFVNDRVFRETLAPYLPTVAAPEARPKSLMSLGDFSLSKLANPAAEARIGQPLCFRYSFRLRHDQLGADRQFKLTVTSKDPAVTVWVNGQEQKTDEKVSGGKREFWLPPRPPAREKRATIPVPEKRLTDAMSQAELREALKAERSECPSPPVAPVNPLCRGWNVLAIRVSPDSSPGDVFLSVRLDEVRKPTVASEADEEVTQKLVTERAVVCDLCSSQWGQVPACVNACPHDAAMRIDARSEFPVR